MSIKLGGGIRPVAHRNTVDPDVDTWEHKALCKLFNADDWFPVGNGEFARYQYEQVRKICNRCPVEQRCLTESLARGDEFGMFGGKTPDERKDLGKPKQQSVCVLCGDGFMPRKGQISCQGCELRQRAAGITQVDAFVSRFGDQLRQAVRAGVSDKALAEHMGVSHYLIGRARKVLDLPAVPTSGRSRSGRLDVAAGV